MISLTLPRSTPHWTSHSVCGVTAWTPAHRFCRRHFRCCWALRPSQLRTTTQRRSHRNTRSSMHRPLRPLPVLMHHQRFCSRNWPGPCRPISIIVGSSSKYFTVYIINLLYYSELAQNFWPIIISVWWLFFLLSN